MPRGLHHAEPLVLLEALPQLGRGNDGPAHTGLRSPRSSTPLAQATKPTKPRAQATGFSMTDDTQCMAEGNGRQRPAITLQNAMADISRLAADVRAKTGAASGTMTPREFFASLLDLRRTRERQRRSNGDSRPEWDIVLQLMVARIDGREPKLSELSAASAQEARQYVERLVEAGLVERFENIANPDDFCISLAGAAALRLAELYRARTRG